MTLAIDVIASCTKTDRGRVADIILGYELATGIAVDENVSWDGMPLGMGSDLIDFMKANPDVGGTYGNIAKAWLNYRLAKFDR